MGVCLARTGQISLLPDEEVFIPREESKSPTDYTKKLTLEDTSKDSDSQVAQKGQAFGKLSRAQQYGFEDKPMRLIGPFERQQRLSQLGVGFICKKGLKPDNANLDDFFVSVEDDHVIAGVFDGHGPFGQEVANTVQCCFSTLTASHPQLLDIPDSVLKRSFQDCQEQLNQMNSENPRQLDCMISGTTATLAVVMRNRIVIAYVGDSRAILVQNGLARSLTPSHIPSLEGELDRILRFNGEVRRLDEEKFERVFVKNKDYPGISMSRTLGNSLAQECGVTAVPTIIDLTIGQADAFLVICTDGVWEYISEDDAAMIVAKYFSPQIAAHKLASLAWQRWMEAEYGLSDDITVVIVKLDRFKP